MNNYFSLLAADFGPKRLDAYQEATRCCSEGARHSL
jgi:hypothetical protein